MTEEKSKLPALADLTSDIELSYKNDSLNFLLNNQPPAAWVKKHPFIANYNYLPIDKVEHLLRKIFKQYKIEVLKTAQLFNAVEVHVRVHFLNPITNEWLFHDGVGACELQTKKDSGNLNLDLSNINKGAVLMALPIAKSVAIKDACDHFGNLFGANLNRKDIVQFEVDEKLKLKAEDLKKLIPSNTDEKN